MNTPILFLIFNRPNQTEIVFQRIREIKPTKLYIGADGPRASKLGEAEICEKVRQIATNIDWECEVKTLFRKDNLGCGLGVSSAISWFFENEEEGIILEDDCLPNLTFFNYCTELLAKYREDEKVMHIGGVNFHESECSNDTSYFFSMLMHPWGWASWRRAWEKYSYQLDPKFRIKESLKKYTNDKKQIEYWSNIYDSMSNKKTRWDTWDFQWTLTIYRAQGLTINPTRNLVSNIGFGVDGTHTTEVNWLSNLPNKSINNLIHPQKMTRSELEDDLAMYKLHHFPEEKPWIYNIINRMRSVASRFVKRKII